MKAIFLVPDTEASPHVCHRAWASTFCHKEIRTPMRKGLGMITEIFKDIEIPKADVLFCESSYCLPFAKKHKEKYNSKIILLVADTTYWKKSHSLAKWFYVWYYTKCVDYFITVSPVIEKQIRCFSNKPIEVIMPFAVNV